MQMILQLVGVLVGVAWASWLQVHREVRLLEELMRLAGLHLDPPARSGGGCDGSCRGSRWGDGGMCQCYRTTSARTSACNACS
jgi:hypothetical protein